MLRVAVAALVLAIAPPVIGADVPVVPAEKRKEIIDAILAKKPKDEVVALQKLKALEKSTINPKLNSSKIPDDPNEPPSFPTKMNRTVHELGLKRELEEARALSKRYEDDPLSFAPGLKGYSKGTIGRINIDDAKVTDVVDEKHVLLTITGVGVPARIPNAPAPRPTKETIMLAGIDTSDLADGKRYALKGVYYVTGNTKSSAGTVMQIIPVELTEQELKGIRDAMLKTEKK